MNSSQQQTRQQQTKGKELYIFDNKIDSKTQRKCFNCGWGIIDTADICENCGEWLLIGKCNFCYADIDEGQRYCSECGNPPLGISCPSCGTLSHFDFCPHCDTSLTEQATETIDLIVNSVEFQDLIKINETETSNSIEKSDRADVENAKLRSYLSKLAEQQQKKKEVFSLNDSPKGNVEKNLIAIEQSKQNIKREEQIISLKLQKETEALKLLEDTRRKTFSSNQEARKFFGALKILLPQVVQKRIPKGWTCNAYNCTHPEGPHECADPSQGGTWTYELFTEQTFIETEI